MASKSGAAGVDNTSRKTWDKAEFADKAKEREKKEGVDDGVIEARKRKRMERDPLHQGLIVQRANLKVRDYQIDLASNLNKTTVHSVTAPLSQQAGFYCDVCDCVLKDSMAYLDHINGKWHNRALGMSMNVEKSTVDQVRKRLEEAKAKKKGNRPGSGDDLEDHVPDGMDKAQFKKEKAGEDSESEEGEEEEFDKGLDTLIEGTTTREDLDHKGGAAGAEEEEEEEDGVDPDFAALMGFGGFGGSKKT